MKFNSLLLFLALLGAASAQAAEGTWPQYGGVEGGGRYSPADQITPENVDQLEEAWTYRTGALEENPELIALSGFQATPILLQPEAGNHLVTCTPFNKVIALHPATGEEVWTFDPKIDKTPYAGRFNCRGLTQWTDPDAADDALCKHSIFLATNDRRLMAIDAPTGQQCKAFGNAGEVDVTPIIKELPPMAQLNGMQLMSPVAVVNGVIVIGGTANKFKDVSSMNGAIRAFDARTGEHLWTFDTLIREGEGAVDYDVGGANVWTTMSWDSERDLLFVPTASASPNFYGGKRPGDNRYANSVLAIRASTGELVWDYQVVHHDVWDWDVPTHPLLVDITRDGKKIPVVVVLTKIGVVFVFHRETGEPFFEIEERPVPTDGVEGDVLSPTQPFPVKPPPLMKVGITPEDAWGFTEFDKNFCRDKIASMRYGGYYTPPSEEGTVMYPMIGGGNNWGGGAFDPKRNILVTPVGQVPFFVKLIKNDEVDPVAAKEPMAGMPMGSADYIAGSPYGLQQGPLLSPSFSPCSEPPWSLLVGVDLDKGEIIWSRPLGVLDKLMPIPVPLEFGTPAAGGAIVTSTGLVFIGASYDERFRAFDVNTGEILWETSVPFSANATPMTYTYEGEQYVVTSAGGHAWSPLPKGDYVVAWKLPKK
jgi:quinoprotein glucose dehydrogenase